VVLPFIHSRPAYFAKVMSELLFWLGEDKILFGSDYGIWTPRWLVDKFMAFELPDELVRETGKQLTMTAKRKILGENAARIYNVDIAAQKAKHARAEQMVA
jgi:predicted TIM-barrel fold metal-dependent hydrolase